MSSKKIHWQNLPASALPSTPDLLPEWDRLNAERADLPFMTASAVCSALQIFGSGQERLLIGREDGGVVAMLLAVPSGSFQWRTFQPSQLPLGVWVAAKHLTTTYLARSLLRGPLGFCLGFSMTQVDPLLAPRDADEPDTKHMDYIDTGWIDILGTFEDYWAARGKNLRQNMRKQRNKLATEGTHIQMRVLTAPEDMAGAIARYGVLESSGWKASEGTAIHPDNPQGMFYIQLLQNAAKHGEAVVYEYFFNEKTVALNLCVQRAGTLVVLKTTYDETIKNYSPAFLLSQDEVEQVFGQGNIKRLEYYGRMMEWHTRWTESKRALYHLTCYRWAWLKKLAERRHKRTEEPSASSLTGESGVAPVTPSMSESHP
ncbi:GNAT family N-acetyltransferase [Rhodoferax sp. WC2427]|uniref:GNAT family N-acetyltransferase n=1 Tax=Rhodoferax sp. WC2427 TaxID=3234144 RepID=UPI003466DEA0